MAAWNKTAYASGGHGIGKSCGGGDVYLGNLSPRDQEKRARLAPHDATVDGPPASVGFTGGVHHAYPAPVAGAT